jgi:hypothetical protein
MVKDFAPNQRKEQINFYELLELALPTVLFWHAKLPPLTQLTLSLRHSRPFMNYHQCSPQGIPATPTPTPTAQAKASSQLFHLLAF